jgi:hypothetical protein
MARNIARNAVFLTVFLMCPICWPLFAGPQIQLERKTTAGRLRVVIVDSETGRSVYARCYLTDSAGESLTPAGVVAYQKPPERHFVTSGEFLIDVPPGKYTLRVERGPEYRGVTRKIDIQAGEAIDEKIEIIRWVNMNRRDWYSGDLHVHRDWREMPQLMLAEDLNLATTITDWFAVDHLVKSGPPSTEIAHGIREIDALHAYSTFNTEVERFGRGALGTVDLIALDAPVVLYAQRGHSEGGYVDLEKLLYPETPALVALGLGDFAEILYNWFTRYGVVQVDPSLVGMIARSNLQYAVPAGMPFWAMDIYYRFLNCGFKLPVSAGSASGVLPNPLGYNRVYVKIQGKFGYREWFQALKAGRSFVTNGPMLFVTVRGHGPGDTIKIQRVGGKVAHVRVRAEATSAQELDRLEIVWKGKVVKTVAAKKGSFKLKTDFEFHPKESGWFAARVFEKPSQTLPVPNSHPVLVGGYQPIEDVSRHGFAVEPTPHFAHTSPVFVQVGTDDGVVPDDAKFFIAWIDREISVFQTVSGFRIESDRQQALTMLREGRSVYERLASRSDGR